MSLTLTLLSCAIWQSLGDTFISDRDGHYQNHTIQCTDHDDCTILCKDSNACKHANIQCPTTGTCAIECNSGPSSTSVCEGITVDCPMNGDCTVQCTDDTACKDAILNGETSTLSVSCDGDDACTHATINGQNTAHLSLQCGPDGTNPCSSLTLYFPQNINDHKMATISAGDGLCSASNGDPLKFYAVNGWNDVEIIDYTDVWDNHIGVMRCGSQYRIECSFKSDDWQCADATDICNDPSVTRWPTARIQITSQTDTATVLSTSDSVLLYAVIATMGICLCFLGVACLCFVRYSHKRNDKACDSFSKTSSMSALPTPVMVSNLSMGSSMSLNSNAPIKFKAYPSSCSAKTPSPISPSLGDIEMVPIQTHKAEDTVSPSLSTEHEVQRNEETDVETVNTNRNTMYLSAHYAPPVHRSLPSVSSGNEQVITYQQPPQHQMTEIMSILNESIPPSLSSFVRNHQNGAYVMNQQPIPPSAQSSTGSVTATHTVDHTATITAADITLHVYKGSDPEVEKPLEIAFISSEDSESDEDMEDPLDDVQSMECRLQTARNYVANME